LARSGEIVFLNGHQAEIREQGDETIASGDVDPVQIDDQCG